MKTLPDSANRKTTKCRTWKVGDYFTLPGNNFYNGTYKVLGIEQNDRLWAYFPETDEFLYTYLKCAQKATKLHKVLM